MAAGILGRPQGRRAHLRGRLRAGRGAVLSAIPLEWKLAGAAALSLAIWGGYEAWAYHERRLGEAAVELADAKAVAKQKDADAALSAKLVNEREAKIRALEASAAQVREVIRYVPVTSSCGAAVRSAADFVREQLSPQTDRPPTRSQPAAAVRTPGGPAR